MGLRKTPGLLFSTGLAPKYNLPARVVIPCFGKIPADMCPTRYQPDIFAAARQPKMGLLAVALQQQRIAKTVSVAEISRKMCQKRSKLISIVFIRLMCAFFL
jgi:hypothetical protein